jgi:hypothetical protein
VAIAQVSADNHCSLECPTVIPHETTSFCTNTQSDADCYNTRGAATAAPTSATASSFRRIHVVDDFSTWVSDSCGVSWLPRSRRRGRWGPKSASYPTPKVGPQVMSARVHAIDRIAVAVEIGALVEERVS